MTMKWVTTLTMMMKRGLTIVLMEEKKEAVGLRAKIGLRARIARQLVI
jgi:hypothetical protein